MKFDISRDFLDGLSLQHPKPSEGKGEVKVNANLQFLPSSPDGRLHTAVVTFGLHVEGEKTHLPAVAGVFCSPPMRPLPKRNPTKNFSAA